MGQKLTYNPTEEWLGSVPSPGDKPEVNTHKSRAPIYSMRHI
jgi:hypothetical protein